VELVIAGNELVDRAGVGAFLERDEMLQQIEESLTFEHAPDEHLELQRVCGGTGLAVHLCHHLEPFLVRSHGADACLVTRSIRVPSLRASMNSVC
jgi:hypothetical protein